MIGTSLAEYVFIRFSILLVRYTHLIYAAALLGLVVAYGARAWQLPAARLLCGLLIAETAFALVVYYPFIRRLTRPAVHPPPLTTRERRQLFDRCLGNIASLDTYLSGWFLGADMDQIRRDNVKEFLLWAFFDQQIETFDDHADEQVTRELNEYMAVIERQLRRPLGEGRGSAKCLRLTFDTITTTYRSLGWYCVLLFIDQLTYVLFRLQGFRYHARSPSATLASFPPRPQELLTSRRSPVSSLGYWYKPHTDQTKVPVVFFHGIGVGLWTYVKFLAQVHAADERSAGVGIVAVEMLPISFRLTAPPPSKMEFVRHMTVILDYHKWDSVSLASHSYGSVLTTHMLTDHAMRERISSVVLVDPVTISLHLPDVAFNFTRRRPKRANEWQLWYFASTDPGVALSLGRYFFWRENIIWKEELLAAPANKSSGVAKHECRTAVCLSGRDLIVDTAAVAQYLEGAEGVEAIVFPQLDHAQVFDDAPSRERLVRLIRSYSSKM